MESLMKFMEMNSIIKTNALFARLKAFDSKLNLEIEAYSCKQTKQQKRHKNIPKPLLFYICALEISCPDHDFSSESMSLFEKTTFENIKIELAFIFFRLYKNNEEVNELLKYFDALLDQCLDVSRTIAYVVDKPVSSETGFLRVFLLHDKRKKRILIIKLARER